MREVPDVADPEHRRLVSDLFTDIAKLEHLIAHRYAASEPHRLPPRQFGVLNWFDRGGHEHATLARIAHDFQWDISETRAVVDALLARGALLLADDLVALTPKGRTIYAEQMAAGVPDVAQLFDEIDMADVRVAVRVLADLRRTLDNLPDR